MKRCLYLLMLPLFFIIPAALGAVNLALWPVNQHINTGESSSLLWLKNTGENNSNLSIRVLSWKQSQGNNYFEDQEEINIVPPVLGIMPGDKAFVRFFVSPALHPTDERAYRIIVDEVPQLSSTNSDKVVLRMRYVLPLFIAGSLTPPAFQQKGDALPERYPQVRWEMTRYKGAQVIALHNIGPVHARLSDITLQNARDEKPLALHQGLFGYVLPGATLYLPLPPTVKSEAYQTLSARFFDGDSKTVAIPHE
jgi:fimbrial chaperone protein